MLWSFLAAILGTLLGLRRICPVCDKDQIVPTRKRRQTVKCKFCGSNLPPGK
jgi:transcription elongation factor Elf1